MDEGQFSTIVEKLDKILRLLTIETLRGKETERDKIELLDSMGFKASQIDKLLGKNPGYTSVVIAQLRKKKEPKVPAPVDTRSNVDSKEVVS